MNPQVSRQVSQSPASPAGRVPGKLPRPIRRLDVAAPAGDQPRSWTGSSWSATAGRSGGQTASGCDERDAANETDRHAAIPGQALTYKLGQLEIERLRAEWVAGGDDVRGFHDALLGLGLPPLASLRAELGGGGGFDR